MESISGLQIATYVFCALIVIIFIAKVVKYTKISTHLRWELYPLAGERNRPWGGSYLEEPEWWTKPREEKSFLGELKFMGQEILFFREYYRLNRGYWYFVYPFHIGVSLFIGFCVLLLIGALTMLGDVAVSAESANVWGRLVYYATLLTGGTGLVLSFLGCVGLFIRRMIDKNLKPYTRRIEYFNLLFVFSVFLTGLLSWALIDHTFTTARAYVKNLITFSPTGNIEPLIVTHIILLLLILAYMPFTNMMHFFAKWFTYHKVRWDDTPNLRGSKIEKKLEPLLNQPLSWSSPHIQPIRYWSDLAQVPTTEEPTPRVRKGVN